jgi:hypothetical protein
MRHYDVATGKPITHEEALSRLPGVVTNPTEGMFEGAGVRGCESARKRLAMLIEFDHRPRGNGSGLVFKWGVR